MSETPRKPLPLSHPVKLIGTWFGAGLSPFAAGTCGSLAALPFAWLIQVHWGSIALFIASIIAFLAGWLCCHLYLLHTSSEDPREMVIDEVAGQWLILSFLYPTLVSYITGLMLFRFFDIVKPWPVSVADRKIHGGFGVMFDDMLAALYPVAIFYVLRQLGYGDNILVFLAR